MRTFLCLVCLFSIACSGPVGENKQPYFDFTGQIKSITLPDHFDQFNLLFRTSEEGGVMFYDYRANEIWASSSGMLDEFVLISLAKEGPNGVGPMVEDIQLDAAGNFWLSSMSSKLTNVNAKGEVIEVVALDTEAINSLGYSLLTFSFVPQADGNFVFTAVPLLFQWNTLPVDQILQMPNVLRYANSNGAFQPLSHYDVGFLGSNLNKHIIPSLHRAKGDAFVVNHNYRDIWVIEGEEISQHPAAHSKFPKDPPMSDKDIFEDMNEMMRIMNYSDIYTDFHYLPSLNLYVRTAKFEDIPMQEAPMESFFAASWGLVFLDMDFKKVGELDLPSKKYNPKYIFATEVGIWVSTTHPDNPDVEEGVITFELIKVNL
jgi:hypothetical protein